MHPQILVSDLKKLPIKNISTQNQLPFKNLVEQILEITTASKDYLQNSAKQAEVREYECKIDQMVYKLYGLTIEFCISNRKSFVIASACLPAGRKRSLPTAGRQSLRDCFVGLRPPRNDSSFFSILISFAKVNKEEIKIVENLDKQS